MAEGYAAVHAAGRLSVDACRFKKGGELSIVVDPIGRTSVAGGLAGEFQESGGLSHMSSIGAARTGGWLAFGGYTARLLVRLARTFL